MKYVALIAASTLTGAIPAAAQEKVFGEAGLSFGRSHLDDVDESLDNFTLQTAGAFVSQGGLGVQLGLAYSNLSVDGGGDLETYTADAHVYGDFAGFKAGAFVSSTSLDELELYGYGAADLDTSLDAYGIEGQNDWRMGSYHGYAGIADIQDADDLEVTIYGLGADYGVTPSLALTADFDGMNISLDGSDDDVRISTFALGADYYTAVEGAPLRLSAKVSRSNASADGFDENATSFNLGATVLFGGRKDATRERLFDRVALPF